MALTRPRTLTMKDLKSLVNNFNAPATKQFREDEVVIDEFAKNIINQVFSQLSIIFPAWKHNWKSDDPANPDKILNLAKMEWTKAFNENGVVTLEQIKFGFAKARKLESNFLPSCGVFIGWCNPTPEDLGYPSEQRASMLCVSYRAKLKLNLPTHTRPLIMELCKRVDWYLMNAASTQPEHRKAEAHFKAEYMSLINSGYQEPIEGTEPRLETSEVVVDRMSPEQLESRKNRGLSCMSDVRRQLAQTNRNKLTKQD